MSVNDLVLVQGMHDTKLALRRWNENPIAVLRPWAVLSTLIAVGLLMAVYVIAKLTPADATIYEIPGVTRDATLTDYGHVLFRNSLVLALHALACVAGFMAGSSLPLSAAHRSGLSRGGSTRRRARLRSASSSAPRSSRSARRRSSSAAPPPRSRPSSAPALDRCMLAITPHALPELIALFLPLAAWMIASRRGDWHELLAATFVTVAIAVPVLLAAAAVETWVTPQLLLDLAS